jgi:Zn-dependent oligopeptidase
MGSGGMYSTLADMLRFYSFVRSDKQFEPENARRWSGEFVSIGGSERGFYMFHVFRGREAEAMLLTNGEGRSPEMRSLSQALEALVMGEQ